MTPRPPRTTSTRPRKTPQVEPRLPILWRIPIPWAPPRDDLGRFYGVYGDPERQGRDSFMAPARRNPDVLQQIPEGYLMIGAMWGDVAPWYMKALSDTRFEQQWVNPRSPPVAEFELGNDGAAVALTLTSIFADRGRLQRLRDLPEKWK